MHDFSLGAHAPALSEADIEKIHSIWLQLTSKPGGPHLHHKDVVTVALELLEREVTGRGWQEILDHVNEDKEKKPTAINP
jgi:hypothetical protein